MKKLIHLSMLMLSLFCLMACNGKTEASVSSHSTNDKVVVKVEGKRSNLLDPFSTQIAVKAYDFKEGKLLLEIMADDLNDSNVHFKWLDDNNCLITIEQRDKSVRTFRLIADENQVQLAEI